MKHIFSLIAISFLLVSCGGDEPDTMEAKQEKLMALKQQSATLNTQISTLENEINTAKGISKENQLRQVEVFTVENKNFEHFIEVQGEVKSDKNVQVFPKASGVITRKFVKEGQRVSAGQNLFQIDAAVLQNAIAEIETKLDLAKIVFKKQENLWNQKIGSEIQYLQAKNNVEALERSITTQKSQLGNSYVKSPISGTVDEFFMNVGEMANPAMPIARVVDLRKVEISAEVSESYTKQVQKGDKVLVSFPAIGEEMPVRINLVGRTINAINRTFRIEMSVDNKKGFLKPNSMAVVKIKDFEKKEAQAVPSNLIQQSASGDRFLYVVRDKKVVKTTIKVGQSYKGETLVKKGLKAGDKIISKGYNEVVDGEEVRVVEKN
ncbi:MAG: membrane fusion protein (multidrug efflux system) [Arenicella sp.]|jgi:membrane fusion protein (multidrug efflux system)